MTIELITGNPGAGKTTYAVAERVQSEARREFTFEIDGKLELVKRRVLVAGIGGLLVEHERLPHTLTGDHQSQKVIDFYNEVDGDGEHVHKRLRGDPPVDLPATVSIGGRDLHAGPSLFNWWLWCRPGDLIVIDEAQFIVPRGTLGRKPPPFIALLEIHRHYGVDFIFITQHPQLLDTTIRNLVGMHRHVRSVMGSRVCLVYAWDHAANPERFNLATKSQFVRRAAHYRLFKSAVAHVKPPTSGRAVLWLVPFALLVAFLFYRNLRERLHPVEAARLPASAPAAAPGAAAGFGGLASLSPRVGAAKVATASDRDWPTYVAEPYQAHREPLDGRAVQWEGGYQVGGDKVALFGLYVDAERVATITLAQLVSMGYSWTTYGPCVGSLRFRQVERLVSCGKRLMVPDSERGHPVEAAASGGEPSVPPTGPRA